MKSLKRKLAMILAVSMILAGVVPAYAAVNDAEGIAIEEDMRISPVDTSEIVISSSIAIPSASFTVA